MRESITLEVIGAQQLVCEGCEQRVERAVKAVPGVDQVRARARTQRIEVWLDNALLGPGTITETIRKAGYETRVVHGGCVPAPRSTR